MSLEGTGASRSVSVHEVRHEQNQGDQPHTGQHADVAKMIIQDWQTDQDHKRREGRPIADGVRLGRVG